MNQFSIMTYSEILSKLINQFPEVEDYAYSNGGDDIGEVQIVAKVGGEGEGTTWYKVFYYVDHNVYIKVDGFHQSYSGVDFDGWEDVSEVRPKEKTITIYE